MIRALDRRTFKKMKWKENVWCRNCSCERIVRKIPLRSFREMIKLGQQQESELQEPPRAEVSKIKGRNYFF